MARNRKYTKKPVNPLGNLEDSAKVIGEKIEVTNNELKKIGEDVKVVKENVSSRLPIIIAVIGLIVSISGISVWGLIKEFGGNTQPYKYEIYLYSEYYKIKLYHETKMEADLNFEADSVTITAHLNSGGQETLELARKSSTEWQKRVYFDEIGVHEITASAFAPNGDKVESTIKIEVIP